MITLKLSNAEADAILAILDAGVRSSGLNGMPAVTVASPAIKNLIEQFGAARAADVAEKSGEVMKLKADV